MKNLKKFEKSNVQNLFTVKGGAGLAGRTTTKPGTTVEFKNDTDSSAGIEAQSPGSIFSTEP